MRLGIDRDRNHVRAHRYKFRNFDRYRFFQPLAALSDPIERTAELLSELYLVLTHSSHTLEIEFLRSVVTTASDMADLVLLGDIHLAVETFCAVGHYGGSRAVYGTPAAKGIPS